MVKSADAGVELPLLLIRDHRGQLILRSGEVTSWVIVRAKITRREVDFLNKRIRVMLNKKKLRRTFLPAAFF